MLKTVRAAVFVAVTLLAVGAFSGAPAAASYYEFGVSLSTTIERDSVPYRLRVRAIEAMGTVFRLEVTLSQAIDPAGPTHARQIQEWTFPLEQDDFVVNGNTYDIDAGDETGPFRVKLHIEPGDAPCSESQRLFVSSPEGGEFRIETDNEVFGTITEAPACAAPYSFSDGPRPGPQPCPVEGKELFSGGLSVEHARSNETARMSIAAGRERSIAGRTVQWFFDIHGEFAAGRFDLSRELTGSFEAGDLPWLEGTAEIASRGPIERVDWYDCRGGREARSVLRPVEISGDLTVDVIGYDSFVIEDPEAVATRSWVRSRN